MRTNIGLFQDRLATSQKWNKGAKRLLLRFAKLTPPDQKNALWDRFYLLSQNSPYRSATFGWLLQNQGEHSRAETTLILALAALPKDEQHQQTALLLFDTHIHLKHWQQVEALWPTIRTQNTDDPARLPARAAIAAAQSNEPTAAIAFWKRAINYDRWRNDELSDLKKAGLAIPLRQIYQDILVAEPNCLPAKLYLNSIH